MAWGRRAGKYNAKKAVYQGHLYHSAKEAAYARDLDLRVKAGELESWRRQVSVPLAVNGRTICRYIVDFVERYHDGTETYIELKGYPHPVGELKLKLFAACYPDRQLKIIR